MIRRKLTTKADREYWAFIDRVSRDVARMPKYLTARFSQRRENLVAVCAVDPHAEVPGKSDYAREEDLDS